MENLELARIIDKNTIMPIIEDIVKITNTTVAISDTKGNIVFATGWQDICAKFHRVHPETSKHCMESDMLLTSDIEPGTFKMFKCKNNLWDISTPITVAGKKLGNLYIGQFFLDDETPDYEIFRSQARRYGFDEREYLDALNRVPRWNRQVLNNTMSFYTKLIHILSNLNHSNLELARSLTEREMLLSSLRLSEEKYRHLVENIYEGIWVLDKDDRTVFVNERMAEMMGYTVDEMQGKHLFDFLDDNSIKIAKNNLAHGKQGAKAQYEFEYIKKDGTRLYTTIGTSPLIDKDGNYDGAFAGVLDMTRRHQMEEALHDTTEQLQAILKFLQAGVVVIDAQTHRIIDVNPTAVEMIGASKEKIVGQTCHKFICPAEKGKCPITDLSQNIDRSERVLIKNSGDVIPILKSVTSFTFKGREHLIENFIDITERKRVEYERQRIHKLESLGILAGGIAHDFNNILTGILGNISLARMTAEPGGELCTILEEAEKASLKARDLTQQLLTFSRSGTPIKKTVSISELLINAATFILRGSNVKCDFSIPDYLWHAEIDEGQISQVVNNLVINAQQAMPSGGIINLYANNIELRENQSMGKSLPMKRGKYIRITVTDHGIGIPEEYLDKIFDPFFTTKQKGSGLGLAISYSIIRNHDGYIDVDSKVGAGSTFYVYLPATENIAESKLTVKQTLPYGTGRILVMDDEATVREVMGRMLKQIGYSDVEFAIDGLEAIRLYQKAKDTGNKFDIVILDLTVPGGIGGEETLKKLREIEPSIKAIVSSGYSNVSTIAEYKEHGFSGAITKPYTIDQLHKALYEVTGNQKSG